MGDSKTTFLLVEDNQPVAELVAIVFESVARKVLRADTVEEALALIEANPDITESFVDASLHVKGFCNTIPVLERLKARGVKRIVAISAHPDAQAELMRAGCTESLPKPFGVQQLLCLIDKWEEASKQQTYGPAQQ